MVSPQNPLKAKEGMASFEERLEGARTMARHPDIRITDIEAQLGTQYTYDTLRALKECFPKIDFVWIMGADNLAQIDRWQRWTGIFNLVPIAVFDRAPYSFDALAAKAARAFARFRRRPREAHRLAGKKPPAWIFFHTRLHPGSATKIRARRSKRARQGTSNGQ